MRRLAVALVALMLSPVHACESIALVNHERSMAGQPVLPLCPDGYAAYAEKRAAEIAHRFEHRAPRPGELPPEWRALGENIGRSAPPSTWDMHIAFMNSPTHRATALAPRWSCVTAGAVVEDGRLFVTQIFVER